MHMTRSASRSLLLAVFSVAPIALAQVPLGYEVIDISSAQHNQHNRPHINNCGEVVFNKAPYFDTTAEVYRYENGILFQITDNDVSDSFPDINDNGTLIYIQGDDGFNGGDVLIRNGDEIVLVGSGGEIPRINNAGQAAWYNPEPKTCLYESGIWFYDGVASELLDPPGLSNQSPIINDLGQIAWTRYDFSNCSFDWTSDIMLWSVDQPEPEALPELLPTPQSVDINNSGVIVWSNFPFVARYEDGVVENLGDGMVPAINNLGDITFRRKNDPVTLYQVWVYLNGEFRWITTDNSLDHSQPEINDYGEVVWWWHPNGGLTPSGIRMMRRMRNADIDNDQDVDAADFAGVPSPTGYPSGDVNFATCMTGPVDTDRLCDCRFFDIHQDRAVDLRDFAEFQNRLGKPVIPWAGNCCESSILEGCTSQGVADCVCATYPQCCANQWTSQCAEAVETLGCAECP